MHYVGKYSGVRCETSYVLHSLFTLLAGAVLSTENCLLNTIDCVRLSTPFLQVLLVVALTLSLSTAALLQSKRGMSERFDDK